MLDVLPALLGTAAILMLGWAYVSTVRLTHRLRFRPPPQVLWKWWLAFGTVGVAVGTGRWLGPYVYPGTDMRNAIEFKLIVDGGTIVVGVALITCALFRRRRPSPPAPP